MKGISYVLSSSQRVSVWWKGTGRFIASHPGAKPYEWEAVMAASNKSGTAES